MEIEMNAQVKNMPKTSWFFNPVFLLSLTFFFFAPFLRSYADDEDLFRSTPLPPNVLVILDNSNSMEEDFYGNAVGSTSSSSKSVTARKILIDLINSYANKIRIGLMTYQLPTDVKRFYLHNNHFFVSYELKSYCKNPPSECVDYCQTDDLGKKSICQSACQAENSYFDATYRDEIIRYNAVGSEIRNRYCKLIYPKTKSYQNSDFINVYYTYPSTLYRSQDHGWELGAITNGYLYSPFYNWEDYDANYPNQCRSYGTNCPNSYNLYTAKQNIWGQNKDEETGYTPQPPVEYAPWVPVDSNFAEGFGNFGVRNAFYYVGQAFESETCPGKGFLQVPATDNDSKTNGHLNDLLAKLQPNENNETGYMSLGGALDPNYCAHIINAGITPTAGTLQSAADYFAGNLAGYQSPIQYSCQKNFIIYATDGLPSADESGKFNRAEKLMDDVITKLANLRKLSKSGTLYDVKTYIVGMGLKADDQANLDLMAAAGGTPVGGHAYYANDQSQLKDSLSKIFADITEGMYAFSQVSVAANRVAGQEFMIQSSFEPSIDDPFWRGHLKKYSLNSDGTIGSVIWDAGSWLQATDASNRSVYTYTAGSKADFVDIDIAPGIAKKYLSVDTTSAKEIIAYIRGNSGSNPDNWKLGDLFHSNPTTVGSPSPYYSDIRSPQAFIEFRKSHNDRNKVVVGGNDGQFHLFNGADGSEQWSFIPPNLLSKLQYIAHCHSGVSGCADLYDKSQLSHTYFVDGPVTVADVWLGSDDKNKSSSDWHTLLIFAEGRGVRNHSNDPANTDYLWSSQQGCSSQDPNSDFKNIYNSSTGHIYYCGYYALDVTDASATKPSYKWTYGRLNLTDPDNQGPYLGEPWSRMAFGKVLRAGKETWVGFIGGGYNGTDGDTRGRGFFVVDLSNGDILWSFTKGDADTKTTSSKMTYSIPASPAIVDTDNDGFVDTAYVGDLGGNVWRFKFCTQVDTSSCNTGNWSGGLLFQASSARPIYTSPTVARDSSSLWVFWGTGDKEKPTAASGQDSFFALKDNNRSTTYIIDNLQDISTEGTIYNGTSSGWYITLSHTGEKMLSDPTTFGGMVLFTTYSSTGDTCAQLGEGRLYALSMMPLTIGGVLYNPGAGLISAPKDSKSTGGGARSVSLGIGVPSAPIVSQNPNKNMPTDLYVSVSGAAGVDAKMVSAKIKLPDTPLTDRLKDTAPSTQIVHWRDGRIQ